MSPYDVANGSTPISSASAKSVRSGRRSAAAAPRTPNPATTKRIPAPKNGDTSSNPTAMTTHVLDQTSTQAAYKPQTTERGTAREGMTRRVRVALMIEGQEDVTWEDWVALADACERSGVEALFRSDHYVSVQGAGERGALDAWATLNALAARTTELRLGTMVTPTSFRHPSVLAKLATTADHVSDGRIELGMGTGWSEIEHTTNGFPFLSMKERMDVLEEQLQIVHDGHWGEGPFTFRGEHYTLEDLHARPRPTHPPPPPLIMGGNAGPRAARLAARFADEYNTVMPTLDQVRER